MYVGKGSTVQYKTTSGGSYVTLGVIENFNTPNEKLPVADGSHLGAEYGIKIVVDMVETDDVSVSLMANKAAIQAVDAIYGDTVYWKFNNPNIGFYEFQGAVVQKGGATIAAKEVVKFPITIAVQSLVTFTGV